MLKSIQNSSLKRLAEREREREDVDHMFVWGSRMLGASMWQTCACNPLKLLGTVETTEELCSRVPCFPACNAPKTRRSTTGCATTFVLKSSRRMRVRIYSVVEFVLELRIQISIQH
jgi:hypothetical protein